MTELDELEREARSLLRDPAQHIERLRQIYKELKPMNEQIRDKVIEKYAQLAEYEIARLSKPPQERLDEAIANLQRLQKNPEGLKELIAADRELAEAMKAVEREEAQEADAVKAVKDARREKKEQEYQALFNRYNKAIREDPQKAAKLQTEVEQAFRDIDIFAEEGDVTPSPARREPSRAGL